MEATNTDMDVTMNFDHFHAVLNAMDLETLNLLQVCERVYESAFLRYGMKYHQEKLLREKYERTIISKNVTLDAERLHLANLEDALAKAGIEIPIRCEEGTQGVTDDLALHEGSPITEGDT